MSSIGDEQGRFYEELYAQYGDDPRSLSGRDRETQAERFFRIVRGLELQDAPASLHEIGCGLGDFGEYLGERYPQVVYSGSDVAPKFVDACRARYPQSKFELRDVAETVPDDRYDYVTLSGTFNIRLSQSPEDWERFAFEMLRSMYAMCRKAISANFLTSYSDPAYRREDLHYQDERRLTDFAVGELSRYFTLDLGGPLYESTLTVYRPEYLAERYPDPAFDRYVRKGVTRRPSEGGSVALRPGRA